MSLSLADRFALLELDDEDVEEKPQPLRFYREDGKLFWRLFDFATAHLIDEHWNNNVVYFDERQAEVFSKDGRLDRPTYTSVDGQSYKEINYSRWKLFEGTDDHVEYLKLLHNTSIIKNSLNNLDFDLPDRRPVDLPPLDNRLGEPLDKLYPKGYQLLVKESRRGGPEWKEGQPLGPDPTREDLIKKPIGWAPPQQRQWRRGLGGDYTDLVRKKWFYGDVDVPLPEDFLEPEEPWSRNPARVVVMKRARTEASHSRGFVVRSHRGLMRSLWWEQYGEEYLKFCRMENKEDQWDR
ncbi:uncharacterized protein F4807DRAFT_332088 [Annulohypoxylon truncatum]|uniref:uncharacterized protein n=1 Tax=Annulohypoxylon truncatum TaxID=327061 RepID=UPI00200790B6|nr:uncharacterized protein F4807DRAFT_332088 [Annulohypoxylon truncatum]KAI1204409.1 hypothetical protein F4807DRAFT_332088 [Annulohypoxylon truncatum]